MNIKIENRENNTVMYTYSFSRGMLQLWVSLINFDIGVEKTVSLSRKYNSLVLHIDAVSYKNIDLKYFITQRHN